MVEVIEGEVLGVEGAGGVALSDERDGRWGEVGDEILPPPPGDVGDCSCGEGSAEESFSRWTGGWKGCRSEDFLSLSFEGLPVGLAEVGVCAVGGRRGWV